MPSGGARKGSGPKTKLEKDIRKVLTGQCLVQLHSTLLDNSVERKEKDEIALAVVLKTTPQETRISGSSENNVPISIVSFSDVNNSPKS